MAILNQSTITLAQAKARILRPVDKSSDSDALTAAGEILEGVVQSLNNKRLWKWTQNITTANVTTDGLITIPGRFKKFYACTMGDQTLRQLDMRAWLRQNPRQDSVGGTLYYIPFNESASFTVMVRDAPADTTIATMYYTKLITFPAADGTAFEVPEDFMDYIISEGKKIVCADFGGSDLQISTYRDASNAALRGLLLDDARTPDLDACFSPGNMVDAIARELRTDVEWWP